MPLRATSDDGDLQSFEFDAARWAELKGSYKGLNLRMPCCQVAAVPKTSTLGNFFFAHARRGECTTAPESAEHLYCKTLIAKAAAAAGWTVKTERGGVSPGGETWVADVFCVRGSAQVALEVQMSPQTREEALRRQARYKASNVRAAWFYGEKLHKALTVTTREVPLFGLAGVKLGQEPKIGLTEVSLSDFVVALLNKRVTWMRHAHTEPFYLSVLRRNCRRCDKPAGLVYGYARSQNGLPNGLLTGEEVDAALERLSEVMTNVELESLGLCHLMHVHQSQHLGVTAWNRCPHCGLAVKNQQVSALVDYATYGPSQMSGLDNIYFDREAQDSGAWVLVSEDGEYKAIAPMAWG
jgi:hypothetical protein